MTIKLNARNFFSYFAFHPNSRLLSKTDKKTAKVATSFFALTLGIGHAICRLFLYKKITKSPSSSTVGKVKRRATTQQKPPQTKNNHRPVAEPLKISTSQTQPSRKQSDPPPRTSCKWLLRELLDGPVVKKTLPPFTDLDLTGHEVLQGVDFLNGLVAEKDDFGRRNRLNQFSLLEWPYLDRNSRGNICYTRVDQADKNLALVDQAIDARVAAWEDALQLSQRISSMEDRSHLEYLLIEDLSAGLEQSAILIALCSKEELTQIPLKELKFSARQLEMIRHRMPTLDLDSNVTDGTLGQLLSFSGNELTFDFLKDLDASVLALLSDEQLKSIKFSEWKGKAAQRAFKNLFPIDRISRLENLSSEQMIACWHLFDGDQLEQLPIAVLEKIDFKYCPLDQAKFNALFPLFSSRNDPKNERSWSKIQYLSIEQVEQIWDWFEPEHAGYLSDEQLGRLSYDFFRKKKDLFHGALCLNDWQESFRRMEKFTDDVRECWDLIDEKTIRLLSKKQLESLDSTHVQFTPELFNALFPVYDEPSQAKSWSRIKELSAKQVMMFLEFFAEEHFSYLTNDQIKGLDFSVFTQEQFKMAFNSRSYAKMALLSDEQIKQCWHLMDEETIILLSDEQIKKIDFKQLPINKELFDALFQIYYGYSHDPVKGSRLRLLSPEQLHDCLRLLDEDQMRRVSEGQIKQLDFTQLNQEQFKGLFIDAQGYYTHTRMAVLNDQQIADSWSLMTSETICLLSVAQIKGLDFKRRPLKQELFDSLISIVNWSNDPVAGSKVKLFTQTQLVDCLPLFKPEQMCSISEAHIKALNFNEGFTNEQFRELFAVGKGYYSHTRMSLLNIGQILAAWDLFDETTAGLLSFDQLKMIMSKRYLSKTIFNGIFLPTSDNTYFYDLCRKKMQLVPVDHLHYYFREGYFDDRTHYLDRKQVSSLDFEIFKEINNGKELLSGMFRLDKPNQMETYRSLRPEQKEAIKMVLGEEYVTS